jgi:hypothetical protein
MVTLIHLLFQQQYYPVDYRDIQERLDIPVHGDILVNNLTEKFPSGQE